MDIRTYLKDLPSGTTLYSVVSGEVKFKEIRNDIIVVLKQDHCEELYHRSGHLWNSGLAGECVLFPSKELRDWELFTKFKKGDIIVDRIGIIAIFDHVDSDYAIVFKAIRRTSGQIIVKTDTGIGYVRAARLATQEEKDLFFEALSKAGYCWNGEEVIPMFKKGDIISSGGCLAIVDHIGKFGSHSDVVYYQACYSTTLGMKVKTDLGIGRVPDCKIASESDKTYFLKVLDQMGYIVKDGTICKKKFNPETLEPYEQVLVRSTPTGNWRCTFFSHMYKDKAICSSDNWPYCIPYKNNEHLRGKSDDCDEFYQWWKND